MTKYTHFTSPIRRIIDTIIHWNITYNDSLIINLESVNSLDKKTKKFHQQINLNNIIDCKLIDNSEITGWLYSKNKNKCLVYFEELGFIKVKLWHEKFNYLFSIEDYDKYEIGKAYQFHINKINGILPNEKLNIYIKN